MSNQMRRGADCYLIQDRRGQRGHVALATSVPPTLKDHLVEYCEESGSTLKQAIEEALRQFLYTVRA